MRKFIEGKGLSLIIDPDIEEKVISCDDTEIERCIVNLLDNAVKFTPEGGEIKEVEQYIEITVEDTGIGLTLVKYIADLHGGYIRLESELNKGSKFTIGLPDKLEEDTSSENLN